MGKPFGDLEKRALAVLAGGGNPAQSQDKELANYWTWRINPADNSHDLKTTSVRTSDRKLDDIGITPFSLDLPSGQLAKVTISQRSLAFAAGIKAALGYEDLGATTVAYRLGKFTPAKVYARTGASDVGVSRTSRITGRKYKSYYSEEKEGYSMPFGEKTAGDTQFERQTAISTALKALAAQKIELISFTPEKARI